MHIHIHGKCRTTVICHQLYCSLADVISVRGNVLYKFPKTKIDFVQNVKPILILAIKTNLLRTTHAKQKKFFVFNVLVSTIAFINIILEVNQLGLFDMTSNKLEKFSHTLELLWHLFEGQIIKDRKNIVCILLSSRDLKYFYKLILMRIGII